MAEPRRIERADTDHGAAIMNAIARRRSIRKYRPEPVDRETVQKLLRAAVLAPTARHFEPWAFVVIQDRALLRRLSGRAKATWPPESASIIERHVAAHVPPPEHFAGLTPDFNVFFDAGTLIVICCRQVGRFAIADCWLAAENLMLAAAGTGLGTCCIGSTVDVLNAPNIKQELGIPHDVDVVAPIVVGFPAEELPAAERKPPVILSWRQG